MKKEIRWKETAWPPYMELTLIVPFWSGNFILDRGIRELIPPVSLNFWRWVGALAILLPFGLPRMIRRKEIQLIIGCGLIFSRPFYLHELLPQGGFSLAPATIAGLRAMWLFSRRCSAIPDSRIKTSLSYKI